MRSPRCSRSVPSPTIAVRSRSFSTLYTRYSPDTQTGIVAPKDPRRFWRRSSRGHTRRRIRQSSRKSAHRQVPRFDPPGPEVLRRGPYGAGQRDHGHTRQEQECRRKLPSLRKMHYLLRRDVKRSDRREYGRREFGHDGRSLSTNPRRLWHGFERRAEVFAEELSDQLLAAIVIVVGVAVEPSDRLAGSGHRLVRGRRDIP